MGLTHSLVMKLYSANVPCFLNNLPLLAVLPAWICWVPPTLEKCVCLAFHSILPCIFQCLPHIGCLHTKIWKLISYSAFFLLCVLFFVWEKAHSGEIGTKRPFRKKLNNALWKIYVCLKNCAWLQNNLCIIKSYFFPFFPLKKIGVSYP